MWAVGAKVHDFKHDQFRVALSVAASAPVATNKLLVDLTTVVWSKLSSSSISVTDFTNVGATASAIWANLTLTSSGDAPTFRYITVYNFTAATQPLVGWVDYGSNVQLNNNDTLAITFDQNAGAVQIL